MIEDYTHENNRHDTEQVSQSISDFNDVILETTPLINKNPIIKHRFTWLIIILIILSILLLLVGLFIKNFHYYIDQSIEVKIDTINLQSFDFSGINYHIIGKLNVNYDNINNGNIIICNIMKLFGFAIGLISINQTLPTKIYIKPASMDVNPLHAANSTFLNPIILNFNNKYSNILDLHCSALPIPYNVVRLMDYMDTIHEEQVLLDVIGYFNGFINHRLVKFNLNDLIFSQKIVINKSQLIPKYSVDTFNIKENNESNIQLLTEIIIENPKNNGNLLNLTIEQIVWEIYLENCQNYSKIGSWKSNPFEIKPGQNLELEIYGVIDSIPKDLNEICSNTEKTSLNTLLQNILTDNILRFRIKAIQNNHLPPWLIDSIEFTINFQLDSLNLININNPPLNLKSIDEFNFEIDNKQFSLGTKAQFDNPLPLSFLSLIHNAQLKVYYYQDKLATNTIHYSEINSGYDMLIVKYNSLLKFHNSEILTSFNDNDFIKIKLLIEEIDLTLSIDNMIFKDIELEREISIKQLKNIYDYLEGNYGYCYNSSEIPFNTSIDVIEYVSSSKDSLEIMTEISIDPKTFSLECPYDIIIEIFKKNHNLTTITTPGISINGNQTTIKSIITIGPLKNNNKIEFEMLASHIISGYSSSIDVNSISSNNSVITNLLKPVKISHFDIPKFDNPFLIESTIHLFGSTVELILFNPIKNSNLYVDVYQATGKYEDVILGELDSPQTLIITPGIYKSPKLPIKINNKIGMDVLQKYLNGDLQIDLTSLFLIKLHEFSLELFYNGHDIKSNVRW
jgi:hypothetical protein